MYRTGDKVRFGEEGPIEFVGRYDDQIKVRGHRVEPGEIEFWLRRQSYLRQALAVARQDASGERRIIAYVVPDGEPSPDIARAAGQALRECLPPYMQPDRIFVLPALPLTPNGKVDRRALPEPTESPSAERPLGGPRTELEDRLAAVWRDVLGLQRVGVDENFFELGGHSLRATQLVSRISREFGVEVPLRAVFERTTIAEQSSLLATLTAEPAPRETRIRRLPRAQSMGRIPQGSSIAGDGHE